MSTIERETIEIENAREGEEEIWLNWITFISLSLSQ